MSGPRTRAGVVGFPVKHSLSPALHRYWLKQYGITGSYDHYEVAPAGIADFIGGLAAGGFAGVNVTIPHKEDVARLVHRRDDIANAVGAVNLVVVEDDGTLTGRSTDGYGFVENLKVQAPQCELDGARVLVLGAGGAAKSILHALNLEGAQLMLTNRTLARAEDLARVIGGVQVIPWEDRNRALAGTTLLVNTTSLGMDGQPTLDVDLESMPTGGAVADCVYAPLETELLRRGAARGLAAVDGLGMLIHQARPAFRAWFGADPEVTDDLREYLIAEQGKLKL